MLKQENNIGFGCLWEEEVEKKELFGASISGKKKLRLKSKRLLKGLWEKRLRKKNKLVWGFGVPVKKRLENKHVLVVGVSRKRRLKNTTYIHIYWFWASLGRRG